MREKGGDSVAFMKRRDIDMVHGPIFWKMVSFVIPVILTNLLQVCYNSADMVIAGLSSEPNAVGAIGTTSSFTSLILKMFIGFSLGANVDIARHLGAGQNKKASRALHTATLVGFLLGVGGAVLGFFISRPVLTLMGNTGNLLDLSVTYTRWYFVALPFHALSNYAISIHRAKGDTTTPLIVLAATGLLNVSLNLFFVLVCGMSVEGVAIATGIAAATSALVLYLNLFRDKGACHFSPRLLCFDWTELKTILYIGLPSGVQSGLFSISNMLIQSSVLQVDGALLPGEAAYRPVVKANSSVNSVENFAFTAVNAVTHATTSFTSQNHGAKEYKRIRRVAWNSFAISSAFAVTTVVVLLLLKTPILALYDVRRVEGDALAMLAYDAAMVRIRIKWYTFILYALMHICTAVMRGLGKTMTATIATLLGTCALRVIWLKTAFVAFPTLSMIYWSYPVSWAVTGVVLFAMMMFEFSRLGKRE